MDRGFFQVRVTSTLRKLRHFHEAFSPAVRYGRRTSESFTGCKAVGGHQLATAGERVDELGHTSRGDRGAVFAGDGGSTGKHQALLAVTFADWGEAVPRRDGYPGKGEVTVRFPISGHEIFV